MDNKDFFIGFAAAIASLIREHDQPSMAIDIMVNSGITLKDLKKAGVSPFDFKPIAKEWKNG